MRAEDVTNISVIGASFIGPGVAQVFAVKGYNVRPLDVKDEILMLNWSTTLFACES